VGSSVRSRMGEVSLMDLLATIVIGVAILSILVYIHEGGHYLAARAFGVRVTELMLGMPGPSIGFTAAGTRFGVTPILLGGYARVCGMEGGEVIISGRSLGSVNVQVILEKLGGGGHMTIAGAQLPDTTPEAVRKELKATIDDYLETR